MTTYFDDYQEHVQRTLDTGGRVEDVDAAMDEYNATGLPAWSGSIAFTCWFKETQHVCSECTKPIDTTQLDTVSPRDEKRCLVCSQASHAQTDSTGKNLGDDA